TGRASPNLLDPIQIDAYGASMPISQVATVNVPEPRLLSVQVWDRGMVAAVEKAIRESDLGLNPQTEGQVIRLRIPEMNEQRRKEMAKVAHKYAEEARIAVRHVRRDGIDLLKKLKKDGAMSEDDERRQEEQVQKATDETISEIDSVLATKEKEIMHVNGRWAARRGLPRIEGHRRGVEAVRRAVRSATELGIRYLTIYSFSTENWRRPAEEVADLMGLLKRFIRHDLAELHASNIRVRIIGERQGLAPDITA